MRQPTTCGHTYTHTIKKKNQRNWIYTDIIILKDKICDFNKKKTEKKIKENGWKT